MLNYLRASQLTATYQSLKQRDPGVLQHRSGATRGEMLVNTHAFATFKHKATINSHARSRDCLYKEKGPCDVRCGWLPQPFSCALANTLPPLSPGAPGTFLRKVGLRQLVDLGLGGSGSNMRAKRCAGSEAGCVGRRVCEAGGEALMPLRHAFRLADQQSPALSRPPSANPITAP